MVVDRVMSESARTPGYGPPPGHGSAPGYSPPTGYAAALPPTAKTSAGAGMWLSLVAIAAIALAVSLREDGDNGWGRIGVWAGFAIFAAALTLAPLIREQLNLSVERAWQVAVGGAAGLAAYWVLFVLPSISQNVSFAATVGVAAGIGAAWLTPAGSSSSSSSSSSGGQYC